MKRMCAVLLGTVLTAAGAVHQGVFAQQDPVEAPTIADQIFNDKPSFLVAADVNRKSREYREGDNLSLTISSEEDAYLYVLYQQADGKVFQVFPNKYQPNNIVKARQTVRVPAENDMFRWSVGAPYGKETVKVIASKEPVDILSDPKLAQDRFNLVEKKQVKGIEVEMGEVKPVRWAESDVTITTVAKTGPPSDSAVRRFGVFIGAGEHYLDRARYQADNLYEGDYASSRNARNMAQAMQEQGRFDGVKLLVNRGATLEAVEEAITKWLPSVSRPGDTVMVYFSGTSGQMTDTSGDESDNLDEYLELYMTLRLEDMAALKILKEKKEIKENNEQDYDFFKPLWEKITDKHDSQWHEKFVLSDDTLARWLQRLAGRQLIFIADASNAGGYVGNDQSKSLQQAFHFDLLEGEANRLKELGQGDQALFCAAHVNESTVARPTKDMSVMTYCLIDYLKQPGGGRKIEDCYQACDTEMSKFFTLWNTELEKAGNPTRIIPSHPLLINNSKLPVILKP